jgi:hypothetical protein
VQGGSNEKPWLRLNERLDEDNGLIHDEGWSQLTEGVDGKVADMVMGAGQEIQPDEGEKVAEESRSQPLGEESLSREGSEEDNLQFKRWAALIQQEVEPFCLEGIDLLKDMEQTGEEELLDTDIEEKMHLSQEMVETITKAKENVGQLNMGKCDKKKSQASSQGPVLIERPRRGKNQGGSMMQKGMELKKKKKPRTY